MLTAVTCDARAVGRGEAGSLSTRVQREMSDNTTQWEPKGRCCGVTLLLRMNMKWRKIFIAAFDFSLKPQWLCSGLLPIKPLQLVFHYPLYIGRLPIPWLCHAAPYSGYIAVTEQRGVFTCVAAGACHSCKAIKYACIKMSCVNSMNLGSLLRAPLFNQW